MLTLEQIDRLGFAAFEVVEAYRDNLSEEEREQLINAFAYYLKPGEPET
jgi:hypothetical protein